MIRVIAHPVRRAERRRTVRDARVRTDIPKRGVPRRPVKHPIPDARELHERDAQLRTVAGAIARRVDTLVKVIQPREDRLHEGVPGGRVRPAPVDVRDEEGAAVGGRAGKDADLFEDYFGGGVKIGCTIGWGRYVSGKMGEFCMYTLLDAS